MKIFLKLHISRGTWRSLLTEAPVNEAKLQVLYSYIRRCSIRTINEIWQPSLPINLLLHRKWKAIRRPPNELNMIPDFLRLISKCPQDVLGMFSWYSQHVFPMFSCCSPFVLLMFSGCCLDAIMTFLRCSGGSCVTGESGGRVTSWPFHLLIWMIYSPKTVLFHLRCSCFKVHHIYNNFSYYIKECWD